MFDRLTTVHFWFILCLQKRNYMPLYQGQSYRIGDVSIGAPNVEQILYTAQASDVAAEVAYWLGYAPDRNDVYYFTIYQQATPVGQILLHDINEETGEGLVGYHLFESKWRGQGIGSAALRLLQRYVVDKTNLTQLTIITGRDNVASQAVATKCGFQLAGGAWEDPENLVVFIWAVSRDSFF